MAHNEPAEGPIHWVYHWYDEDERNLKTIGYFSSAARANAAVEAVRSQPGFRDHPDGFGISECQIDVGSWQEGFGIDGD